MLSPQRKVPFLPGHAAASYHSKGKGAGANFPLIFSVQMWIVSICVE